MATVAVVDDHELMGDGLRRMLLDSDRVDRVEVFGRTEELLEMLDRRARFDACLLDLGLPGLGGIESIEEIHRRAPGLPILIVTAQSPDAVAGRCLRAGAQGFVSKGSGPTTFLLAVDRILDGERNFDRSVMADRAHPIEGDDPRPLHERLSNREFDIMRRLAEGQSIREIASTLGISPKSVSTYRRRCLEKMGFSRNAQLTEYVLTNLAPPLGTR